MTKRIEQSRRHGHYDPRHVERAEAPAPPRIAAPPEGRYEMRYGDGTYAGTFVTGVPAWHVGDAFVTGDGRGLRITEIVQPELIEATDRPAHGLWEVERT